jgi:glycosyltransferase involved in cell wall biosynthesis
VKVIIAVRNFKGGGAERVSVNLANALAEIGNQVKIYTETNEGPYFEMISPLVEVVRPERLRAWSYVVGLRKLIKHWQPDVVQSHQTMRNVLSIIAHKTTANRNGRAIYCLEHGDMGLLYENGKTIRDTIVYYAAVVSYPLADRIIAVSDNVKHSVEKFIRPFHAKLITYDNPVVFPKMQKLQEATPSHKWLRSKTTKTVVSIGRLEDQKNYALLIDAFYIVSQKMACQLIIYGEGSLRANLEAQIAKLGLQDRVSLPGFTKNPFAEYKNADLFVLSSVWEGLPTVAIEALACGVCVVSTDNSQGVREVVCDPQAGCIVKNNDPLLLASAIEDYLKRGRQEAKLLKFVVRFDAVEIARKHLLLYQSVKEKNLAASLSENI